jgi:hypothetical protein
MTQQLNSIYSHIHKHLDCKLHHMKTHLCRAFPLLTSVFVILSGSALGIYAPVTKQDDLWCSVSDPLGRLIYFYIPIALFWIWMIGRSFFRVTRKRVPTPQQNIVTRVLLMCILSSFNLLYFTKIQCQ